ncbi:uncharacterized protein LOC115455420 [Manduca sexta]|uniref:Uncharacterized protein n=1 Tax=Manduca sexta TaxID=7130 RepID=A0A921YP20_MANSE|nr:uncharacterized protein LOC119190839 [Manduca sexta]XP_037302251.1 uncharacterized protein LOC115455420 [Manduca sexta]KAG6442845.1 hypothetical protein O3G_MSEX002550 [Manduca sexta]
MALFLYFLALYYFLIPCSASYVGYSYNRMGMKIIFLDMELVKDAERKIQSIQNLKNFYRSSHNNHLGTLVYDIRFKFKRMVRLYRVAFDKMNKEDHNEHVIRLMEVRQLSMEIDHLVQAIVEGETNYAKRKQERNRKLKREMAKTSDKTTTKQENDSLRVGRAAWYFQSPDPWNRPRPRYLRTPVPKRNIRRYDDALHVGTKHPIDSVELNY